MAMEAAVHQRNLESSILFMQQEHAKTLKALHDEIHKLQKQCTDLTFQLTMNGIGLEQTGDIDAQLQEVQAKLQEATTRESFLIRKLAEKEDQMQILEQEQRTQKKQHLDEMRNSNQTISTLKAEVELKSNNIAYLTTELHRLKVKQKMDSGGVSSDTSGIVKRPAPQYGPLPVPRDMLSSHTGRTRHRGGTHTIASPNVRRGVSITGSSTKSSSDGDGLARSLRRTSARSSGSESPDISPFVQRDTEVSIPVVEVKKPSVLPPISGTGLVKADRSVHQVVIAGQGRGVRGRPSTPEIATLAVDQVGESSWNRAHESHSSEYN